MYVVIEGLHFQEESVVLPEDLMLRLVRQTRR